VRSATVIEVFPIRSTEGSVTITSPSRADDRKSISMWAVTISAPTPRCSPVKPASQSQSVRASSQ
jgi:hypothetical protein